MGQWQICGVDSFPDRTINQLFWKLPCYLSTCLLCGNNPNLIGVIWVCSSRVHTLGTRFSVCVTMQGSSSTCRRWSLMGNNQDIEGATIRKNFCSSHGILVGSCQSFCVKEQAWPLCFLSLAPCLNPWCLPHTPLVWHHLPWWDATTDPLPEPAPCCLDFQSPNCELSKPVFLIRCLATGILL